MASVLTVQTTKKLVTTSSGKKKLITRQQLRKYSWLPDVLRLQGSIFPRIIGPVLTVTIFASIIAYLWDKGYNVALPNSVVPLLSVVVGLILVFRNGTSYDRYWEGRKDFQSTISQIRNLSRLIWVNVAVPPADDPKSKAAGASAPQLTAKELRRKKVRAMKLCVSYAFAVKHYLRGEDGLDWEDYLGILPPGIVKLVKSQERKNSGWTSYSATEHTTRAGSTVGSDDEDESPTQSGASQDGSRLDATKRLKVKRSKDRLKQPGVKSPNTPLLSSALHSTIDFHPSPESLTTPLPLVIAHELGRTIFKFKRDGYLETVGPAGANALNTILQSMVDNLGNMERVANTPIPRSYSIHLKQTVTLYLFSLPFTLIKELGWGMIPVVTVVAFTLMGIEGIADEIEMPFGLDKFDLPLGKWPPAVLKTYLANMGYVERYCEDLKEDVQYVIERLPEGGEGMYGVDDGEGDD
ncbi:Bestrophin, RFP-TM, chloride channel-domain-containing protein [Irpex lacteus]|nr:Bestrophin, RFP-TM, chloride channel-domain-containing protein [Irpex lacteus]